LTQKQEFKFLTPVYVPIKKLEKYMQMSKSNLEIKIMKSIYLSPEENNG